MADTALSEPSSAMDTSPDSIVTPSVDPSSLRAAALMTLKSKRRKPAEVVAPPPSLPQRPQATFDVLDYGSTEAAPAEPQKQPSASTSDPGSREEGEISDEEPAASAPPTAPPQPPRPALPPKPAPQESPVASSNKPQEATSPSLLDRIAPPSRKQSKSFTSQVSPVSQRRTSAASQSAQPPPPPPPVPEVLIDAEHVRPGLTMTQEQYDTAKDIILDLLGWGVHPDHLYAMGLSREIIYYVFSELNLRFPANLDTEGLIPYTPNMQRPEPTPQRVGMHHSLPPKPPPLVIPGQPLQQSGSRQQVTNDPPSAALLDMEQQRRQELLARKRKAAASKPSRVQRRNSDVEMRPPAPIDEVEDFLQSIAPGPSAHLPPKPTFAAYPSVPAPSSSFFDDDMDVDEIPGLSSSRPDPPPPKPAPPPAPRPAPLAAPKPPPVTTPKPPPPAPKTAPLPAKLAASVQPPQAPAPVPPTSTSQTPKAVDLAPTRSQIFAAAQPQASDLQRNESLRAEAAPATKVYTNQAQAAPPSNGNGSAPQPTAPARNGNNIGPRGKKRPGAIDYIEAEDHRPPPPRPFARANSFAGGVGTAKRFIIDISDAEDDHEHRESPSPGTGPVALPLTMTGGPITGMSMVQAPKTGAPPSARGAPPSTRGQATPTNGTGVVASASSSLMMASSSSTASLQEQIRRMKEAIAAKEMKMQAARAAQGPGTPSGGTPAPASATTPPSASTVASPVITPATAAPLPTKPTAVVHTPSSAMSTSNTPVPAVPEPLTASLPPTVPSTPAATKPQVVKSPLKASAPAFQPANPIDDAAASSTERPPSPSSSTASSTHSSPATKSSALPADNEDLPRTTGCALASDSQEHPYPGSDYPYPDLRRLKLATAARTIDPAKTVCKFEVPGGGLCRDPRCTDAHIASFEPSGESGQPFNSRI
ncbi:hypothetical protein FB107DRAFT_270213 [Schizophyllum commune]